MNGMHSGGYTTHPGHWSNEYERYGLLQRGDIVGYYASPFTAVAVARTMARTTNRAVTIMWVDRSTFVTTATINDRYVMTVGGGVA